MAPKKEMASEAEDVEDVVEASEAEASEAEESDVEASDVEESDVEASEAEASDVEASDAEESDVEAEASDAEETSDVEAEPSTVPNTSQKKPIVSTIGIEMLKSKTQKKPKKVESDEIEVSEGEGEEEDDEEEEEDVNYLQKFDNKMRDNFILDHHPEARTHNYEEVKALTRVTRDGRGIIIDPLHKTIPFLTKYEMTRVIGQRAKQLDSGAKSFAKVPINVIDGYYIALLELEQKKLPFIIKRPYPNGGVEYWNVSDLELLI